MLLASSYTSRFKMLNQAVNIHNTQVITPVLHNFFCNETMHFYKLYDFVLDANFKSELEKAVAD